MMDFNKCVTESGLVEFPTQGNKNIWSDKHEEKRILFQNRLDIHQQRTMDTMPSCKTLFFPEGISDHYPAKVVLNEEYKTRKAFTIVNVWTKHSKFLPVMQEGRKEHKRTL